MDTEPGLVWRLLSAAGLVCLVGAYLVNQRGRCRADGLPYLLGNAAGAGLLAIYSVLIGEWVFVALEGFWSAASLHAAARALRAGGRGAQAAAGGSEPGASRADPARTPSSS